MTKTSYLLIVGLIGITFALAPSSQAAAIETLSFTEYSDSLLKVSVNGGAPATVFNQGANSWSFDTGISALAAAGIAGWAEPNESGQINFLLASVNGGTLGLNLFSGVVFPFSVPADGMTQSIGFFDANGVWNTLNVQFTDLGDERAVADGGSTLLLLGCALAGLYGLSQLRFRGV